MFVVLYDGKFINIKKEKEVDSFYKASLFKNEDEAKNAVIFLQTSIRKFNNGEFVILDIKNIKGRI